MLTFRSRSMIARFVTSDGFGASGMEPSWGMEEGEEMAGESWAEPKM